MRSHRLDRSFGTARLALLLLVAACGDSQAPPAPACSATPATAPAADAGATPASLPNGLLLALSQFEIGPDGKPLPKPGAARLEILIRDAGAWSSSVLDDPESNVFHKAMVYAPHGGRPGILTLGGNAARVKLWHREASGWASQTLWGSDFGGKTSRMRDVEIAALGGAHGASDLAVATHDQGVVETLVADASGQLVAKEIDREKNTFVHEIEAGDLDGDGVTEVYATPSEPNRLDGTPQAGHVVRYVPEKGEGRVVVADLGRRHAKEILVDDVDGDGRDELYVSVEAATEGEGAQLRVTTPIEVRRYDAGTDPAAGIVIAQIQDRLCRFLTVGDIDGDGKKEMVAAAFRSGLWLLRPTSDAKQPWTVSSIDRNSSGFEHAALLADLDGNGTAELYVASDDQGEVRRYVWTGSAFAKETIHRRTVKGSAFVWNLMPVPVELVR